MGVSGVGLLAVLAAVGILVHANVITNVGNVANAGVPDSSSGGGSASASATANSNVNVAVGSPDKDADSSRANASPSPSPSPPPSIFGGGTPNSTDIPEDELVDVPEHNLLSGRICVAMTCAVACKRANHVASRCHSGSCQCRDRRPKQHSRTADDNGNNNNNANTNTNSNYNVNYNLNALMPIYQAAGAPMYGGSVYPYPLPAGAYPAYPVPAAPFGPGSYPYPYPGIYPVPPGVYPQQVGPIVNSQGNRASGNASFATVSTASSQVTTAVPTLPPPGSGGWQPSIGPGADGSDNAMPSGEGPGLAPVLMPNAVPAPAPAPVPHPPPPHPKKPLTQGRPASLGRPKNGDWAFNLPFLLKR